MRRILIAVMFLVFAVFGCARDGMVPLDSRIHSGDATEKIFNERNLNHFEAWKDVKTGLVHIKVVQ